MSSVVDELFERDQITPIEMFIVLLALAVLWHFITGWTP